MTESGSSKPTALQRGQMRRRLRHQQRIREALLLDLGALVFELHRQGRREPELLQAKAAEVSAVDNEVRALAEALEADASLEMLAPGVAGICANCGTLLSTDDRFCPNCGTPSEPALAGEDGAGDELSPEMEQSDNGATDHPLEEGEQEALGAAPPPESEPAATQPPTPPQAPDLGTRMRENLGRVFGRRPPG